MQAGLLGCITTPGQGNRIPDGALWCADNGCFGKGYPGDEKWFAWLQRRTHLASTCAFATAPDVVGDAAATLERSLPWLPRIRELGYPAAYVAQDGLENTVIPWDYFDVLFIGGSDDFKLGKVAREATYEAKARGKWVHMGRVSSFKRIQYADHIGCDSVDGRFISFGPDRRLPEVLSWLHRLHTQDGLFS